MLREKRTLLFVPWAFVLLSCSVDVNHGAKQYSCAEDGLCPSGFECVDDICVEPGQPGPDAVDEGSDAAPATPDAEPGDPDANQGISVAVAASDEDAEELVATGVVDLTSTDLELAVHPTGAQIIGLRFSNLDIGIGEAIASAHIQFQVDEATIEDANLEIRTDDSANPAPFVVEVANLSARTTSATSVSWTPAAWPDIGAAGADQRTPDLAALVQERVNDPEWRRGNSMVFIITGTGTRTAEAFDGDPAAAPRLVVDFQ